MPNRVLSCVPEPAKVESARLEKNNFDLLRLLFALIVCLVHAYELSGFQQLKWIAATFSSSVAVKSFFVVSGFLIFMSYERSPSLFSYARKRLRRIYPAYFAVIIGGAFGLLAVSSASSSDYFSLAWGKYILANLAFMNFLQPTLPGVFDGNKLSAVNGALWTLKIEVMFYLSVPLFAMLFRRYSRLAVLLLVYGLSVGYASLAMLLAARTGSGIYVEIGRQLPGQLAYFMAGAFLYYFLPLFERHRVYFLLPAASVLVINAVYPLPLLEPFALAVVVVFFGIFFYLGNFGRYGDFSYGFYILHFPVIQLFLYLGWFRGDPWLYLLAVIFTTLIGAIGLWHAVEKRFLFRSSHYIAAIPVETAEQGLLHAQGTDIQQSV